MASIVPREEMSLDEKLKKLDQLSDSINKKAGKVVIGRIGRTPEIEEKLKMKFIATPSLEVNEATGGGFPVGKTTILAGNPDSGKTHLLLNTIAENMNKDPNFLAIWVESENSLHKGQLSLFGIDPNRMLLLYPGEEGAEDVLDMLEASLKLNIGVNMVVINSLKMLTPKEEVDKSFKDASMGLQARLNAKMQRKFTPIVADNDAAFILVCHLSNSIGSYGKDPLVITGGVGIKFGAMLTLDFRKKSVLDTDPVPKEGYMKIGFSVKKNHCVSDRSDIYRKSEYYVEINKGIEQMLPLIDLSIKNNILAKGVPISKMWM